MANSTYMPRTSIMSAKDLVTAQALQVSTLCFGAYLYFILDFFLRFSARIPGYGAFRPTVLMFLFVTVLLFFQGRRLKGKWNDPIFKAFYVLLIYLVVSLPFVEWPGSVIRANAQVFMLAASFLFFTALIIDSEKRLRIFLGVFLGCQTFRVLEPLYLNITQGYWGSSTWIGDGHFADRLAGAPADVINPNELGFVIVTAIPFLHYFLWYGRWYAKLLYISLLPLFLHALILTMSRGAFLALIVVAAVIFWHSRQKILLMLVGVLIVFVGWSIMSQVQQDRYASLLGGERAQVEGVEGRKFGMIEEFRLGFKRPIFGHGIGSTKEAKYHEYRSTQASHNFYAELLIEIGIIGAIIFFVFLKRIYNRFKSNRQKLKELCFNQRHFYTRLNMAMVAVFWMYLVYSINYWGLSQYYWYLFGGLAIAYGRILDSQQES